MNLRDLLGHAGVEEVSELRGRFGFMAFHGGSLEERTDVIARIAAERAEASYYGVHQPAGLRQHVPSHRFTADQSSVLAAFLQHVDVVITVHGYGRRGLFTTMLLGGTNRTLAAHVAPHLRRVLPAYRVEDDIEKIPKELRGLHPLNPVNAVRQGGVQLELPPRVRGTSPLWWDWEGPHLTPHTNALIDGLVDAAASWSPTTERVARSSNRS
ncbi:MAG: hypothetical protein RL072_1595 [Actinomycetota bacterium]|jgi:phage replication-related protein YjqB (UPF0714/DUF867 family)